MMKMKNKNGLKNVIWLEMLCLIGVSCSTTKNLPEGEILYTGKL